MRREGAFAGVLWARTLWLTKVRDLAERPRERLLHLLIDFMYRSWSFLHEGVCSRRPTTSEPLAEQPLDATMSPEVKRWRIASSTFATDASRSTRSSGASGTSSSPTIGVATWGGVNHPEAFAAVITFWRPSPKGLWTAHRHWASALSVSPVVGLRRRSTCTCDTSYIFGSNSSVT